MRDLWRVEIEHPPDHVIVPADILGTCKRALAFAKLDTILPDAGVGLRAFGKEIDVAMDWVKVEEARRARLAEINSQYENPTEDQRARGAFGVP